MAAYPRTILFSLLAAMSVQGEIDSLYDSSAEDLPWPPPGEPAEWPGKGERFGKHWPRTRVAVLDRPPEFLPFEKDFMFPHKPAVIEGLASEMQKNFNMEQHASTARAALAGVLVQHPDVAGAKSRSFSEFYSAVKKGEDGKSFVRDQLHKYFKEALNFPSTFRCGEVVESLLDTRMSVNN